MTLDLFLHPIYWVYWSALLGLCVGSFLNVVIYRLPVMMENQWTDELALANETQPETRPAFNLIRPRSRCSHCKHTLAWWENIPVLSFVLLRGRCSNCRTRISWRYPAIELLTAIAFVWAAVEFPPGGLGLAWMAFLATLIALAMIDYDTYLLPDTITLPLMWAGVGLSLLTGHISLEQSVLGAMVGYMTLWVIFHVFKLLTAKEGMGFGDFKLLAAVGAWIGVEGLLTILFVGSVVGVIFGIILQMSRGNSLSAPFPFGPSLVIGTFVWLLGFNLISWVPV